MTMEKIACRKKDISLAGINLQPPSCGSMFILQLHLACLTSLSVLHKPTHNRDQVIKISKNNLLKKHLM